MLLFMIGKIFFSVILIVTIANPSAALAAHLMFYYSGEKLLVQAGAKHPNVLKNGTLRVHLQFIGTN